jgi:vacuolar iron transporter family protein
MLPLVPLFFGPWLGAERTFLTSALFTAATFATIGVIRGRVSEQSIPRCLLETLFVGGSAAVLAFGVGAMLRRYVGMD